MYIASIRFMRGSVTLGVMMALLFGATLVVFFANRSALVEIKTSANQVRAAKAMEAAEAGQEWSLVQLNSFTRVNALCNTISAFDASDRTFRQRYLDPDDNPATINYSPLTPGCIKSNAGWSCSCPSGSGVPILAGSSLAFTVAFSTVDVEPSLVKITSTGCASWPCSQTEGTATTTQIIKFVPSLLTPPAAPLTAKGNVDFGSNAITVTNTDTSTNGITINAGGTVNGFINSGTITTVPGTPPQGSLVGNDTSLSTLTDDQMFRTFFGRSKETFRNSPSTTRVNCPSNCTDALSALVNSGVTTIWIKNDMNLQSNATFGSEDSPLVIVVDGNVHLNGSLTLYGVLYSTNATWDNTGGGTARVVGALIAEGDFTTTGTPDPTYDVKVLKNIKGNNGHYVKVPGSWKDFGG